MRVVSFYFVREISAKERFHKDYEKIVGDDAAPIMPQAMAKVVKETPRDREVIDTLKRLSGARTVAVTLIAWV